MTPVPKWVFLEMRNTAYVTRCPYTGVALFCTDVDWHPRPFDWGK